MHGGHILGSFARLQLVEKQSWKGIHKPDGPKVLFSLRVRSFFRNSLCSIKVRVEYYFYSRCKARQPYDAGYAVPSYLKLLYCTFKSLFSGKERAFKYGF